MVVVGVVERGTARRGAGWGRIDCAWFARGSDQERGSEAVRQRESEEKRDEHRRYGLVSGSLPLNLYPLPLA